MVNVRDVHHDLIHGDATEYRAIMTVEVHSCSGVGKVVQVAVPEADADGGYAGGSCGDVGVVVGHAVIAGQGAQEGYSAVEREGVLQFSVIGGRHGREAVENASQSYHIGTGCFVIEHRSAAAKVTIGDIE